jgi:hypothetical protein
LDYEAKVNLKNNNQGNFFWVEWIFI